MPLPTKEQISTLILRLPKQRTIRKCKYCKDTIDPKISQAYQANKLPCKCGRYKNGDFVRLPEEDEA